MPFLLRFPNVQDHRLIKHLQPQPIVRAAAQRSAKEPTPRMTRSDHGHERSRRAREDAYLGLGFSAKHALTSRFAGLAAAVPVVPVPAQMWHGVSPVLVQMWQGCARRGAPSPGADVVGVSPVLVQMWQGRAHVQAHLAHRKHSSALGQFYSAPRRQLLLVCSSGCWAAVY